MLVLRQIYGVPKTKQQLSSWFQVQTSANTCLGRSALKALRRNAPPDLLQKWSLLFQASAEPAFQTSNSQLMPCMLVQDDRLTHASQQHLRSQSDRFPVLACCWACVFEPCPFRFVSNLMLLPCTIRPVSYCISRSNTRKAAGIERGLLSTGAFKQYQTALV